MSAAAEDGLVSRPPDLFELVEADHRRIHKLLNELTGDEAVPSWRPGHRKTLAQRLVIEESRHEVTEEQFFWPAVREKAVSGIELRAMGLSQEQRAKRLLKQLDRAAGVPEGKASEADGDNFTRLLRQAAQALREHMYFEEVEVIPRLRTELNDTMAQGIGSWYEWAHKRAPTRPHPHTPPIPGILRSSGKMVAMTDRVRDFVTRRGR